MNLTTLETTLLNGYINMEGEIDLGDAVYTTVCAEDFAGLEGKTISGVLSSLVQKGLIDTWYDAGNIMKPTDLGLEEINKLKEQA
jgi:hypothetical protein